MMQGARLVGLLILWVSVGFFVDAATADYQYRIAQEQSGQEMAQPTPLRTGVTVVVGAALAVVGVILLARRPGEGAAPGVPLGREPKRDGRLRRCWRCRAKWPAGAERCPRCAAERLR